MLLGRSREDLGLIPLASTPPPKMGPEPHPADGDDGQGSARCPQCWSFACFFLFLAGKAGRVGCKPCPWNLLSQLGSRMSTTSDREMERHRRSWDGRRPVRLDSKKQRANDRTSGEVSKPHTSAREQGEWSQGQNPDPHWASSVPPAQLSTPMTNLPCAQENAKHLTCSS